MGLLAAAVLSCGRSQKPSRTPERPPVSQPTTKATEGARWPVARVPRGTIGPHWAEQNGHRVAVWVVPEGQDAGWYTLAWSAESQSAGAQGTSGRQPPAEPQRIADALEGIQFVRAFANGVGGFTALVVRRQGAAHVVEALEIDREGVLRSGPLPLGESPAQILWLDAVPTARGGLVAWAERMGDYADLYVVPTGPLGAEGAPRRVARRAAAWQLKAFGRSAALASIETQEERRVVVRFVGDDGAPSAPELVMRQSSEIASEIDLAVTRERAIVAWTERTKSGRRVLLGQVERDGTQAHEPWPLTPPRGSQTLLELVAAREGAEVYAAWEEAGLRPRAGGNVLLARVGAPGEPLSRPAANLFVDGYDGTLPAFAARSGGVLAVTRGMPCRVDAPECEGPEDAILAVELDARLVPRGTRPVVSGSALRPAELLWDVACTDACWGLAATSVEGSGGEGSTEVSLVRLEADAQWEAPVEVFDDEALPALERRTVLGPVLDLAGLEGWFGAEGPVLTWLSYFDPTTPWVVPPKPAPDGKRAPVRALLRAQSYRSTPGGEDSTLVSDETLSYRAHSLGGLAVAPGPGDEKLVVWSALDNHEPQVFATLVDGRGKRLRQRMITRTPGEVLDVAAVRLDKGWLLAWIDGRGDDLEVYTTRLDEKLESAGPEVPLTSGAVLPTGVQLLAKGQEVFVTWSGARASDETPQGDIFLAILSGRDGSVLSPPRRVAATEQHSHSPQLAARESGLWLGWLEGDPDLGGVPAGTLVTLALGENGGSRGVPVRTSLEGNPTGLALTCAPECRAAVVVDAGSRTELWAARLEETPGVAPTPRFVTAFASRHAAAVAPLLLGDSVYTVDARGEPELWEFRLRWR